MISLTRNSSRWAAAGLSVFALALASAAADGCGGIDCTETETCPGVADAALDQRVVDVTLPSDGADSSVEPDSLPGDETTVTSEPVDMGDAEAGAFDATLDAEVDATEEPEVTDAELDAEAGPHLDARADAADAAPDVRVVDACPNAGGPENCTNGIDDNCDGLIDCADPLCVPDSGFQGYICVPTPPTGWIAPVAVYDFTTAGGSAPTPPPCSGNYPDRAFIGHDDPMPPASTCSCTCGGAGGGSCTSPQVTFYSSSGCGSPLGSAQNVPTMCGQVTTNGGINGIRITNAGTPSGGACDAGVSSSIPAFDNTNDWLRTGAGCTTAREQAGAPLYQGGCATGHVCVENPQSSLGGHICAVLEGSQQLCGPGGAVGYDAGFTYYESETDSRTCSGAACTCGAPSLSCTPNVTLGGPGSCSVNQLFPTTSCASPNNYPPGGGQGVWAMGSSTPTVVSGCTPSGTATISGGITKTGVVTVCCTQ